jgi:hypothetical protein
MAAGKAQVVDIAAFRHRRGALATVGIKLSG